MTEFDKLLEEYSNKSRTIKRTERYPKNIVLSRDFLERLEEEYFHQYSGGNRNFHSNFLKALSFELDRFKDNPEMLSKYASDLEDIASGLEDVADAMAEEPPIELEVPEEV